MAFVRGRSAVRPQFERYIGVDYSGAQTPSSSLKGLRVYFADGSSSPQEVLPPPSPRKYWTRREVTEWLVERLLDETPTLVGIDHGFSFPIQYFEKYRLPLDWPSFLDDFQRHWPTDENIYVDFVRDGSTGNGAARSGNARWRRLTELRARTAKSVFQFDMQGSVAKSTHAGIPWLRISIPVWSRKNAAPPKLRGGFLELCDIHHYRVHEPQRQAYIGSLDSVASLNTHSYGTIIHRLKQYGIAN